MQGSTRLKCGGFSVRVALGLFVAASFAFATPESFVIAPANSNVEFRVRHLTSSVTGTFSRFAGEFTVDRERPEHNSATFAIEVASLVTDDERRTARLARDDFFATARFPMIRFESRNWKRPDKDGFELTGDLTIKGITKAVVVRVTPPNGTSPRWEATAKLGRRDFDVDGGPPGLIGDEVEIRISLVAERAAPGAVSSTGGASMIAPDEPGERLTLRGTVYAADGTTPVPRAKLYAFHTDASGVYSPTGSGVGDERNPRLQCRLVTDDRGRFEIRTILPGPYPGGKTPRHIHLMVSASEGKEHNATFSFAGDPNLTPEDYQRHGQDGTFSSIRPTERDPDGALRCVRDIRLRVVR